MGCGPTSKACGEGEAARHIGESCNDREWKGTGTGEAGCDQPGAPSAGAPLPPRPAPAGSPPPPHLLRHALHGRRSVSRDAATLDCSIAGLAQHRCGGLALRRSIYMRRAGMARGRCAGAGAGEQGDAAGRGWAGSDACAQEWAWAGWSDCWCANAWA